MGKFLDTLNGRYITGEDSGTCVADMHVIRRQTAFVAGLDEGPAFNGDPAPFTALGTVYGIQAALRHQRGSDSLQGISIAVQGAGAVGRNLIRTMVSQGVKVFAADTNPQNMAMAEHLGAIPVSSKEILELAVDVLAPCAMGAILNQQSIPRINAAIIAGAANNQLAELQHGEFLRERGILHAPDFAINAGGIIRMHHQGHGTTEQSAAHIARIGDTLTSIFRQSDEQNVSTTRVAEQLAEKVLATGHLCHG
jgi:leucine dehydrogenase